MELFTASPEAFYGAALMDIEMPVMDGYAAAGMNAHVAKPVDPAVLFAVLEKRSPHKAIGAGEAV